MTPVDERQMNRLTPDNSTCRDCWYSDAFKTTAADSRRSALGDTIGRLEDLQLNLALEHAAAVADLIPNGGVIPGIALRFVTVR